MKQSALLFSLILPVLFLFTPIAKAGKVALCDSTYHWVDVGGTKSLDGTETGFQYICLNGSTTGPLLIYLEGGGGCWDGITCDCQPDAYGNCQNPNSPMADNHFDVSESFDGQTWGHEQTPNIAMPLFGQTAAFSGPTSPFTGGVSTSFNFVILPYSTGDAFIGKREQKYITPDGRTLRASHVGHKNVTLDLRRISKLFPNPNAVVIWGDSAGGVGADCNLSQFRGTWSATNMWEMNNAGIAYGTNNIMPVVPTAAQTWGAWKLGHDGEVEGKTCPIVPQSGSTDWNLEWVVRYNANTFQDVPKAFTDDYSDQSVAAFACLFGATVDPDGTCTTAVTKTLNAEFGDVISTASNYKVYYHTGICHAERVHDGNTTANGSDPSCDWDVTPTSGMVQSGIAFHDWVNAWTSNSPSWINVQ